MPQGRVLWNADKHTPGHTRRGGEPGQPRDAIRSGHLTHPFARGGSLWCRRESADVASHPLLATLRSRQHDAPLVQQCDHRFRGQVGRNEQRAKLREHRRRSDDPAHVAVGCQYRAADAQRVLASHSADHRLANADASRCDRVAKVFAIHYGEQPSRTRCVGEPDHLSRAVGDRQIEEANLAEITAHRREELAVECLAGPVGSYNAGKRDEERVHHAQMVVDARGNALRQLKRHLLHILTRLLIRPANLNHGEQHRR